MMGFLGDLRFRGENNKAWRKLKWSIRYLDKVYKNIVEVEGENRWAKEKINDLKAHLELKMDELDESQT